MDNDRVITAKVYYTNASGVHYLKLKMFGMYISDITVQKSPKYPEKGPYIQMPKFRKADGSYKKIIEFQNDDELYKHIKEVCIKAVEDHLDKNSLNEDDFIVDDLMSQDEYEKGLNDVSIR